MKISWLFFFESWKNAAGSLPLLFLAVCFLSIKVVSQEAEKLDRTLYFVNCLNKSLPIMRKEVLAMSNMTSIISSSFQWPPSPWV